MQYECSCHSDNDVSNPPCSRLPLTLLCGAVHTQCGQGGHGERHFPVPAKDVWCDKANQQTAQCAANCETQIEMRQVLRPRLGTRELTVTHHAAKENAHDEHRQRNVKLGI